MSDDGKTRIRFAKEADAAVIARIHMTSRSATMPYLPPQKRNHEQVTRWVRDVLLKQCRTWVAVRAAEISGYAALDGDMLEHLYLHCDIRRQGIGTLLLDEVRRHSPDGVSLHVFQQNTEARAFYEGHGFTVRLDDEVLIFTAQRAGTAYRPLEPVDRQQPRSTSLPFSRSAGRRPRG